MSKPRGEGAWWRSAGTGRTWVAPSDTGTGDKDYQREFGTSSIQHGGNAYSELTQSGSGSTSFSTSHGMHDGGVDSLIDGVLGGGMATATVVEAPVDTITDTPRKPIVWPPKPTETKPAVEAPPAKKGLARVFDRAKPRSTRDGHWTYNGLRPRTRVLAVFLVVGALVGAGVLTMRALAATAGSTFSGELASESPLQLNFPATGLLTNVYVHVGQTVHIGQPLASQKGDTLAAAVDSDRLALAADVEQLGQLLGTVGQQTETQAAQAYARAQTSATSAEQRGVQNVADDNAVLANEQANLTAAQYELNTAQQDYNAKCSSGLGVPACAALAARVSGDTVRVNSLESAIKTTQSRIASATAQDKTLNALTSQALALAAQDKAQFTATELTGITAARVAIAHAQSALAADLNALGQTNIVSPANGEVLAINGLPGEVVGGSNGGVKSGNGAIPGSTPQGGAQTIGVAASTAFIVIQESPGLEAVAQVPETSILSIKNGETASVSVDALGGQSYPGHVVLIDPAPVVDAGQIYYDVYIVPNTGVTWPTQLLPDMGANIKIGG